jgi:hypothetical protein
MDCFASLAMTNFRRAQWQRSHFDKIKAGLEEAKAYLDGSAKKCDYGIYVPVQKK